MSAGVLGFVGLGRMGSRMATRLLAADYELIVFDTNIAATDSFAAKGAKVAASPRAVADLVEIVLTSLPDPDVVTAVALGPDGLTSGERIRCLVDFSTIGPGAASKLATELQEKNITWVESPVSGGPKGAQEGTLAVMYSCPPAIRPEIEPILTHIGRLFFAGEKPGLAQTAKLANNLLSATAMVVSSEAMAMGVKAGLDPQILLDILNAGSGRNSATADKFPRAVLTRNFDFGFANGLLHKDVRLCLNEAEAIGVPMLVGTVVRQMLAITDAKFGPESDMTSVAKIYEEWSGVEITAQ